MNGHLFLQGDIDIGKSTIIREAVMPYINEVGGFFTVKLYRNKSKVGFALRCVQKSKDYILSLDICDINQVPGLFMYEEKGKWNFNIDIFSTYALECLTQVPDNKLIIMDEVGGMELKNPVFVRWLTSCLNGNIPILGVLKSKKNLNNLHKQTKFDIQDIFSLWDHMYENDNIEVLTVTNNNKTEIRKMVKEFVKMTIA